MTALVERHGGPSAVGEKVGAHRTTVHRWMGGDIGMDKLGVLADKLGTRIVVTFGPQTQIDAAPSEDGAAATLLDLWRRDEGPPWAHRLTADIMGAIQELRDESVDRMIVQAVRGASAELREQIREELARDSADSTQHTPEAPEERSRSTDA